MYGFGEKLNKFITDISGLITEFIDSIIDLFNKLKEDLANVELPTIEK